MNPADAPLRAAARRYRCAGRWANQAACSGCAAPCVVYRHYPGFCGTTLHKLVPNALAVDNGEPLPPGATARDCVR